MSKSAENDTSSAPVSLVLEIRGKNPVLVRVIFRENGKQEETLEPQKRVTTKAIATVLTLFRACSGCASFRITSKKKDKHLVKFIVSAVRETNKHNGKIYSFADGKFLKLFLAPPDPEDFSYVDLDLRQLKPASITVTKDGLEISGGEALNKLAEQLATSGGWKLWADYLFEASPAPSSPAPALPATTQPPTPPLEELTVANIEELASLGWSMDKLLGELIRLDYLTVQHLEPAHEGTVEQWVPIFESHPETWRVILLNRKDVVGYWCFAPLFEEDYKKLKRGELRDCEVTVDSVACLELGGDFDLYFIQICLLETYRGKATKLLFLSIAQVVANLAESGVFFREICANAYTPIGKALCRTLDLRFIASHVERGELFGASSNDILKHPLFNPFPNLRTLYGNRFVPV